MAGIKEFSIGRSDLFKIDPKQIKIKNNFNARKEYGDIEALKISIINSGLKNPLRVYAENEGIFLIDGHRRLTAIMQAINEGNEIKYVECINEPRIYNDIERTADLIRCNSGNPLTDLELCEVIQRLKNFNLSIAEISNKTGLSIVKINNILALNIAAPEIKKAVQDKKISSTTAAKISRKTKTKEAIENINNEILEKSKSGKKISGSKISILSDDKPEIIKVKKIIKMLKSAGKLEKISIFEQYILYLKSDISISELVANI